MGKPKPVEFRGSALEDLRTFPLVARREAGFQLDQVQQGGEPDDWKPMPTIGKGVREIRIRERLVHLGLSMWPSLPMLFMCCTVFKKRPKKPAKPI